MKNRNYVPKSLSLPALLACIAGTCTQSALAEAPTLPKYINDTNTAYLYWPFENSFISDIQSTFDRTKPLSWEKKGIGDNGCPPPLPVFPPVYETAEYFPILPDHMTRVGASSALIFGEVSGNVADSRRYLELTSSNFDSTNVFEAIGMEHKNEWTMHMVTSPADNATDRGWETLFETGDRTYYDPADDRVEPIRVIVDLQRETGQTRFRVRTESQNYSTKTAELVVLDTDVKQVSKKNWYQVVVQYYINTTLSGDPGYIRLRVNTVKSSLSGLEVVLHEDETQSNEWRSNSANASARIGVDLDSANPFHGAIHHFAIWDELIDSASNLGTPINALGSSFLASSNITDPDPRDDDLTANWDAPLRYFMWDQPIDETIPVAGARDLRNWRDEIWDHPATYPLVRMRIQSPDNSYVHFTPPGYSAQSSSDPETTQLAGQTANWLEYLNAGLVSYTASKSLFDTSACALLWHNYAKEHADQSCYYGNNDAIRRLTNNWRDAPSVWRDAGYHPVLDQITYHGTFSEVMAPFYREGMSQNAFRTKDIFIELANQIASANTAVPNSIPTPSTLHFDTEEVSNIGEAWNGTSGPSYVEGWWTESVADSRAMKKAHWIPPSSISNTTHTLHDFNSTYSRDLSVSRYARENSNFRSKFSAFARDQYDHALGVSLLIPAIQELFEDMRMSEYSMIFAGDTVDSQDYLRSKPDSGVEFVEPRWIDYSSPVLYPIKSAHLYGYWGGAPTVPALFAEWGERLGLTNLNSTTMFQFGRKPGSSQTDQEYEDAITQDANTVFVELAKHNLNASYLAGGGYSGTPIVPWLVYPGSIGFEISKGLLVHDWNHDGIIDDDDEFVQNPQWEDVARIAAFAHRHGVREYIFWGNWDKIVENSLELETMNGLDNVFDTIDNIVITTPTGFTTSADFTADSDSTNSDYGVPNGTVDFHDMLYFAAIHGAQDLEADIAGAGPNGNYPNGIVGPEDTAYFSAIYLASQ